jgi:hypothetical protein
MAPRSSPLGAPPAPSPSSTPTATLSTPSAVHHLSSSLSPEAPPPFPATRSKGQRWVDDSAAAASGSSLPQARPSYHDVLSSPPLPQFDMAPLPLEVSSKPPLRSEIGFYSFRSPHPMGEGWKAMEYRRSRHHHHLQQARCPPPHLSMVSRRTSGANASTTSPSCTELSSVVVLRDVSAAWSPSTARPVVRVGSQR